MNLPSEIEADDDRGCPAVLAARILALLERESAPSR